MIRLIESNVSRSAAYASVDVRYKLIFTLFYIISVLTLRQISPVELSIYTGILLLWTFLARPDIIRVFKRLAIIIPFVAVIAFPILIYGPGHAAQDFDSGIPYFKNFGSNIEFFLFFLVRIILSTYALILLTVTCGIVELIKGMRGMRVPPFFIDVLFITLRYIEVIAFQSRRLIRGRKARTFDLSMNQRLKSTGGIIGSLFVRSILRSQNLYNSMQARGYSGEIALVPEFGSEQEDITAVNRTVTFSGFVILYTALLTILLSRIFNG